MCLPVIICLDGLRGRAPDDGVLKSYISFSLFDVANTGELAQSEIKERIKIARKEVKMSSKPCHPIVGGMH